MENKSLDLESTTNPSKEGKIISMETHSKGTKEQQQKRLKSS